MGDLTRDGLKGGPAQLYMCGTGFFSFLAQTLPDIFSQLDQYFFDFVPIFLIVTEGMFLTDALLRPDLWRAHQDQRPGDKYAGPYFHP